MSMYWSMLSSTAPVCIVDLTSILDLICVCWNVTYAEELLPWCYLVAGASTSLFMDLSGPPWHPSRRLDSRKLCGFLSVCVGHLRAVFTTLRHRLYCTESVSIVSAACSMCRSIS